jgi:glycine/D-amino acid oxidase-like deaminating enzyme
MSMFDVGIVGGGIVGCSAALHLRRRGASVILLEQHATGSQASGVNYGGVRQQGRPLAELPLARRSHEAWLRLSELLGTDCEFAATGHLKLARSESEMAELETYAEASRPHGLKLELIGRQALRARYPWLGDAVVGGSLCAEDGQANPRLVSPAYARASRAAGAMIIEGVEVVGITATPSFVLRTARGDAIEVARLVNAAGAWGATVAAWFGEHVPETAIAPNMCVTEPLPYFIEPNLGVCGGAVYLRQIPRGSVIFGGGHGVAHLPELRSRPIAAVTAKTARVAIEVVPRLATAHIIRTWTGIEGRMADGSPVLSASRTTPRLVHAFGFCGRGFALGPGVGEVVAELVLDGATSTPISAFTIDRFAVATRAAELS